MKKEVFLFLILSIFLLGGDVVLSQKKMKLFEEEPEKKPLQETKDIKKILPQPKFEGIKEDDLLKGKTNIKVEVAESLGVEFYLRQPQSLMEIYLGNGKKEEEGKFSLEINTQNIPNGEYFLFTKVLTPFGEYQGPEVKIRIENEIEKERKKEEEIKKEIEPVFQELEEKQKEVEKITEESKREFERVMEETTRKIEEKIPPEEKEKIENILKEEKKERVFETSKELENLKMAIENEVRAEKKILSPKDKEEVRLEKENIKENIVKHTTKPIEKVEEKLPPEEKVALRKEIEEKTKTILEKTEQILKEKIEEKSKISPLTLLDSDLDDLSDWDEVRIGTDPSNPDSDGDGYLDGVEFKLGFDPKDPGPADKIVYQDAKKFGRVSERLKIEKVELVSLGEEKEILKIYGQGIPNSFVTIYIYSKPIIALAKVDANGYFQYTLDKGLTDGTHTVYVVLTNNKGDIEEKSSPFLFVKTGGKVLRISELEAELPKSPVEIWGKSFLILTISLVIFALSLAFFLIGFLIRKQGNQK